MSRYCHVLWVVVFSVVSLVPGGARGQTAPPGCQNDMQCKGDRICVQGQCQSPTSPSKAAGPPARRAAYQGEAFDPGWSMTGAIIGWASLLAVASLGAGSAATSEEDEDVPSLPLGIAATIVGGVMIPISAAGARSASERGLPVLRVFGWISYGLFLANAMSLIVLGVADVDIDYVVPIASTTTLGSFSSMMFAIDGMVAYNASTSNYASSSTPGIAPYVSVTETSDGNRMPTLGMFMRF